MSKRTKNDNDGNLEDILYSAARSLKWLIEKSESEVRESEVNFDEDAVVLPESLSDPLAGIDRPRPRMPRPRISTPSVSTELQEGFARAARERRGEISPEIEEKMRRDRERAEAEIDDTDDS